MALSNPAQPDTPYFSKALLKVIFTHSARFLVKTAFRHDEAKLLMKTLTEEAHFSLAMNLTMPSSIPTIQALLQQSAREVAFGNSSQGKPRSPNPSAVLLIFSLALLWYGFSNRDRFGNPFAKRQTTWLRQDLEC
jgi:hypothetical protein